MELGVEDAVLVLGFVLRRGAGPLERLSLLAVASVDEVEAGEELPDEVALLVDEVGAALELDVRDGAEVDVVGDDEWFGVDVVLGDPGWFDVLSFLKRLMHPPMSASSSTPMTRQPAAVFPAVPPPAGAALAPLKDVAAPSAAKGGRFGGALVTWDLAPYRPCGPDDGYP